MSVQLIQQYYTAVEKIIQYSGTRNESSLRKPFQDLLEQYARAKNLLLVAEVEMISRKGNRIRPDGVIRTLYDRIGDIGKARMRRTF